MTMGEVLTRATVWVALLCYTAVEVARPSSRDLWGRHVAIRWLWTLGGAAYLAHVAAAFHFYHGWSHATAYAGTAHQTEAVLGLNWGGGLYFNYFFTVLWFADAAWFWVNPRSYQTRPRWVEGAVRGFFLFMVVNATIIFGRPAAQILGALILWLIALAWFRNRLRKRSDL